MECLFWCRSQNFILLLWQIQTAPLRSAWDFKLGFVSEQDGLNSGSTSYWFSISKLYWPSLLHFTSLSFIAHRQQKLPTCWWKYNVSAVHVQSYMDRELVASWLERSCGYYQGWIKGFVGHRHLLLLGRFGDLSSTVGTTV